MADIKYIHDKIDELHRMRIPGMTLIIKFDALGSITLGSSFEEGAIITKAGHEGTMAILKKLDELKDFFIKESK